MALDKTLCQILKKTLLVPAAVSGNAMLKVLGVPPMSFGTSKSNACFAARIYDAMPNTLTAKIPSRAADGWCSAKRKSYIRTREKDIHLTKIKMKPHIRQIP